jgi:hypothetical protein
MLARDLLDLLNTLNPRCTRLLVDVREHLQEASLLVSLRGLL